MRRFLWQMGIVVVGITALLWLTDIFYTWSLSRVPVFGIRENEKVDYLFAGDSRTSVCGLSSCPTSRAGRCSTSPRPPSR